jgi:hypothetical protein
MLHVWLIPACAILLVGIAAFYLVLKARGGSGVRTDGRTVMDKADTQEDAPPQMKT